MPMLTDTNRLMMSHRHKEKMLDGRRICFIRCEQYKGEGDVFEEYGSKFRVTRVEEGTLEDACQRLWAEAGYDNYQDLVKTWITLRGNYIPTQKVYIHHFEKV